MKNSGGREVRNQEVKKPNGELCRHPQSERWNDLETGETGCRLCGEVLVSKSSVPAAMKFSRGPENAAVFNHNLGSTSKPKPDQPGAEPCHYHALAAVYGNHNGSKRPLELITQTCPSCGRQHSLRVFGDVITCQQCDSQIGEYILQIVHANVKKYGRIFDLQFNGNHSSKEEAREIARSIRLKLRRLHAEISKLDLNDSSLHMQLLLGADGSLADAIRVLENKFGKTVTVRQLPNQAVNWNQDLRRLQHLLPVDDDPLLKTARELLSQRLDGKLSPENANMIAQRYLEGVKKISRVPRRTLVNLLDSLLESEGIAIEN
jgi:transcription elongation factor Elf1